MSTIARPAPTGADPRTTCWYADPDRHPTIGRCPAACNGVPTHGERKADGAERAYCEAHAHWRRQDGGRYRLYPLQRDAS